MKKVFYLFLMLICGFGFIGVANAESAWPSEDVSTVNSLLAGADLTGKTSLTELLAKYDVYYSYVHVTDSLLDQMLDSGTYTDEYASQMEALIPTYADGDAYTTQTDIAKNQITASNGKLTYTGLTYSQDSNNAYTVAIFGIPKDDTTKIYAARDVYQVTSSTTVNYTNFFDEYLSSPVDNDEENNPNYSGDVEEDVATETNPNTGIEDYFMYLVPLALVGGSVLMFRRRYA